MLLVKKSRVIINAALLLGCWPSPAAQSVHVLLACVGSAASAYLMHSAMQYSDSMRFWSCTGPHSMPLMYRVHTTYVTCVLTMLLNQTRMLSLT